MYLYFIATIYIALFKSYSLFDSIFHNIFIINVENSLNLATYFILQLLLH